jgi:hypothetical protein
MKPPWLVQAEGELGFHEGANNDNKFGKFYGINHQPWCAMFCSWACATSGHPLPVMQPGMRDGFAGVSYAMHFAQTNGFWRHSWDAEPGDLIIYGWNGPGSLPEDMHVGFVVSSGPRGTTGHTIEGNRADQVERQTFTVGERVVLGTVALSKMLLEQSSGGLHVMADVQPRHPDHPHHSGPTPLSALCQAEAVHLTSRLEARDHPIAAGGGERKALVRLQEAIDTALART